MTSSQGVMRKNTICSLREQHNRMWFHLENNIIECGSKALSQPKDKFIIRKTI